MHRIRGMAAVVGVVAAGALAGASPAEALGELRIEVKGSSVVAIGDWRPARNPTIDAAAAVFGQPSSRKALSENGCRVRWRKPQLSVVFADFGGGTSPICEGTRGKVQTFSTHDPSFATQRGLYAGASVREARRRHKKAKRHGGSLWLYTANLLGHLGPVLEAKLNRDRSFVAGLKGSVGAAGE